MRLDWSKKQIEQNLKNINSKRGKSVADKELKNIYKQYLFGIQEDKIDSFEEIKIPKDVMIDAIEDKCIEFATYINLLPEDAQTSIFIVLETLDKMYIDNRCIKISKKSVSNEQLLKQSYDIFNSISPSLIKYLNMLYKNKNVKTTTTNPLKAESCCFFDETNNQDYVYFSKMVYQFLSEESMYNHELAHAITGVSKTPYLKTTMLSEFHSIYTNLYTDKEIFDKTKNNNYLYSYYNYLKTMQEYLICLSILLKIAKNKITEKNLRNVSRECLYKNSIKELYQYTTNIDLNCLTYLVSGIAALHLQTMDKEKSNHLFYKTIENPTKNISKFFKLIELNYKDIYYMRDIFNEANCTTLNKIRKLNKK